MAELDTAEKIRVGQYIVIQRQKYTKLHKFSNLDSTAMLGKDQLELRNIEGKEYYSTFKMIPKDGKNKKLCKLEVCSDTDMRSLREILGISECGADNRNICDDGGSQTLKPEDIDKLRELCSGSSQIVEKIVENSKTFNSKTEYAQEKYLKKKEKKYFEFVQIRKPSIRLLSEIYYRQDPDKIMGIRLDTLSQLLSYSGVCSYGNHLLYESGTCGLIPAAFINALGPNTEAKIVHMHPGNVPQKQAVLALELPDEQANRCISVNLYSVLREFYQKIKFDDNIEVLGQKRKITDNESESTEEDCLLKRARIGELDENDCEGSTGIGTLPSEIGKVSEKPLWQIENKRACDLLAKKFDSLVIIAREHPWAILKALLQFVKPSRPIVIFNLSREILMEIYVDLKSSNEVTGLHLVSNWMRLYQILPNRTHPEVNMNGNSGYILYGYTIRQK